MLKDNLDDLLTSYDLNITAKGKDVLENLANNYKNLFFKSGNPTIDNYDFLKRFGTLYDFLLDLLSEKIGLKKAAIEQNEMIEKIVELKIFVLLEEKNIDKEKSKGAMRKAKTKTQRKKTISIQKSDIFNAARLFDKRSDIIDAFSNK